MPGPLPQCCSREMNGDVGFPKLIICRTPYVPAGYTEVNINNISTANTYISILLNMAQVYGKIAMDRDSST